jgi:alkylated DNA repair dioxygenase AlkB
VADDEGEHDGGPPTPPARPATHPALTRYPHPEEVTVQRYAPDSAGISTHRDGRRHAYLVAILTLEGSALLRQCSDRAGTTVDAWDAGAGSLVLLRGPGLGGIEDDRPLHAVDGPGGHRRTSLTLRETST